jgi:hypothetical protein
LRVRLCGQILPLEISNPKGEDMLPALYARYTLAKEQTKAPGTPPSPDTPAGEVAAPGGVASKYLDAAAALVPADVLGFHALVVSLTTENRENRAGDPVTTITDPFWLKLMLIVGCIWAAAEYFLVHRSSRDRTWDRSDTVRMFIPAAAFIAWTMLQRTTSFDAWFPNFDNPGRTIVAAALVALLGIAAKVLADVAGRAIPEKNRQVVAQ